ncbi:TPA: sigma-54-dependent Fis family transcriptional regulator [bacterium]|nr:sigma-54-dependent Fis family transcriptional regulator [bacterium]
MQKILIIDDHKPSLEAMASALASQGYGIVSKSSGKEGLNAVKEDSFDVILTDLKMPDIDGMEILRMVKDLDLQTQVILITAHGSIDNAVEAMKAGAVDYIPKPIKMAELREKVRKALDLSAIKQQNELLQNQNIALQQQINEKFGFSNIIGNSKPMQDVFEQLRLVSPTNANVLIYGETGTGKELVAHAIHANSLRKDKPFIPINCAAISSSLLESELFGHEKGSFTGAIKQRQGAFELANGGTLLLDEVSEMNLETQAKFLRVIEEQQFMRLGGVNLIKVDVRIISSTNRNLASEVEKGKFREDLYYRLKVVTINLPPLRDRKDDIPLLINAFIDEFNKKNGKKIIGIDKDALELLKAYNWQGNVRQLRNYIESMVVMSQSKSLGLSDLPDEIKPKNMSHNSNIIQPGISIQELEKEAIKQALISTNGNRKQASDILKISLRTLQRKIKEYNIN